MSLPGGGGCRRSSCFHFPLQHSTAHLKAFFHSRTFLNSSHLLCPDALAKSRLALVKMISIMQFVHVIFVD